MKFFTLLFLTAFIFSSANAQQDTVPNPGFEQWLHDGANYEDPVGWTTLNPITGPTINVITCSPDSAAKHSGNYCAKLVSIYSSAAGQVIPGLLTTGTIDVANETVVSGIPIASRPLFLNGWYEYTPGGKDTGAAQITLFNGTTTIGTGAVNFSDTVSQWTSFSAAITYTSGQTPDTVQILISSSVADSSFRNSTVLVDDLSYSYTSGISETEINPINLYPNPASKQVYIDNKTMQASSLNVYSSDGRLVTVWKMHEGINIMDVSGFAPGIYVLNATDNQGRAFRSNLVVEKN